jgi:DNA-binding transcriptional LysR family regulator
MRVKHFDLRHLRYFVAVAEELHFGRAAKRLHIAQPPLSQQIKQLERIVGASLLRRTSRSTGLTAAGAVFLEHARQLLKDAERAGEAARRAGRGEVDTVVVGFTDSAALSVLPEIIRQFREVRPDVHLELTESSTHAQLAALERGARDVVIVRGPVQNAGLHVETLLRESFTLAVPDDHPLARKRSTQLAKLAHEPFVLFPRHLAPEFHDQLIAMCIKAGFSPEIRAEAGEYQTILSLVAGGLGICPVPVSVKNLARSGVSFVSLSDVRRKATVVLVTRIDEPSISLRELIIIARTVGRSNSSE